MLRVQSAVWLCRCCWFFCCYCFLLLFLRYILVILYLLSYGSSVWFRYVSFHFVCRYFCVTVYVFFWLSSIRSFVRSFHSFSMDHMNCLGSISFTLLPIHTNSFTHSLTHSSCVDLFGCFVCIQNIILNFSNPMLSISYALCIACFVFVFFLFLHLPCKCVCNAM